MRFPVCLSPLAALVLVAGCVAPPAPAPPIMPASDPFATAAERGAMVALNACARCHQVRPDRPSGQEAAAPSFMEVANLAGRSPDYLRRFATTRHVVRTVGEPQPTMPTLFLSPEDREDVIAFIRSYRRSDAPDREAPEPLEAFE
jgi:mono/diheme cytochrome c family protein